MQVNKLTNLPEVERVQSGTVAGLAESRPDTTQPIYLPMGPFSEFRGLTHKHHLAMEHELAKDTTEPSFPVDEYTLGDVE